MLKSVFGAVVLAVLVSPAFATEFWVQYDYSTHECSIVEKKSPEDGTGTSQGATGANTAPNGATSSAPNTTTTPTMLPASSAPAKTIVITPPDQSGSAASPNPVTASGTPPATPDKSTAANPDDDKKDPYAATTAAWAKKKAEAEAAGTADIQTALIGTAMHTREEAESEMQIMRKCGIAN